MREMREMREELHKQESPIGGRLLTRISPRFFEG